MEAVCVHRDGAAMPSLADGAQAVATRCGARPACGCCGPRLPPAGRLPELRPGLGRGLGPLAPVNSRGL